MVLTLTLFYSTHSNWRYFAIFFIVFYFTNLIAVVYRMAMFEVITVIEYYILLAFFLEIVIFHYYYTFRMSYSHVLRVTVKDLVRDSISRKSYKLNSEIKELREQKVDQMPSLPRLYHLYHMKAVLSNNSKELGNHILQFQKEKFRVSDVLIGIVLLILFTLQFVHLAIPQEVTSLKFAELIIDTQGFQSMDIFVWYLFRKIGIIAILIIWYLFGRNWWRFALLPAIILYLYQFWEIFQENFEIAGYENFKLFPAIGIILVLFMFLSRLIRSRIHLLENIEYLNSEFNRELLVNISESDFKI